MSALNIARLSNGTESKNLSGMSIDQEMRYLRRYCSDHPLAEFIEGVGVLFEELPTNPGSAIKPNQ